MNVSVEELRISATWEDRDASTGVRDWRAWLEGLRRREDDAEVLWDAEDATGGFRVGSLSGAVGPDGFWGDFDDGMAFDDALALARRLLESVSEHAVLAPHVTYDLRLLYDLPARWHGPLRRLTSAARLDPWVAPGIVPRSVGLQYYLEHEGGRTQIRLDLVPEWVRPDVLLVRMHAFDAGADRAGVGTLAAMVARVIEIDVPRLVMLADR